MEGRVVGNTGGGDFRATLLNISRLQSLFDWDLILSVLDVPRRRGTPNAPDGLSYVSTSVVTEKRGPQGVGVDPPDCEHDG